MGDIAFPRPPRDRPLPGEAPPQRPAEPEHVERLDRARPAGRWEHAGGRARVDAELKFRQDAREADIRALCNSHCCADFTNIG